MVVWQHTQIKPSYFCSGNLATLILHLGKGKNNTEVLDIFYLDFSICLSPEWWRFLVILLQANFKILSNSFNNRNCETIWEIKLIVYFNSYAIWGTTSQLRLNWCLGGRLVLHFSSEMCLILSATNVFFWWNFYFFIIDLFG